MAWVDVVHAPDGLFQAGGVLPRPWLPTHINQKESWRSTTSCTSFALDIQKSCGERKSSWMWAVKRSGGRLTVGDQNRVLHELLIPLFDLQFENGFVLSLKWVPTAENVIADIISRPLREAVPQLLPAAFQLLWDAMGPFDIDLMACTASAQVSPVTGLRLPFFARYSCPGSPGRDVLAQNVAVMLGTYVPAFGYCFPPLAMTGHVVEHLAECRAHAVLVAPDTRPY